MLSCPPALLGTVCLACLGVTCTTATIDVPGSGDSNQPSGDDDRALGDESEPGDANGCAIDVDRDGACPPVDCDDEDPDIGPHRVETCHNGFDDDCNGEVDDSCTGGDVFYVDGDSIGGTCNDDNPGTLTAPWCTVAKANTTLTAGQTVFLRAGVYAGETVEPTGAGTSDDARIIYAAYPGEAVTFTSSVYCVRLRNTAYVTILGIVFSDCERNLYIQSSDHNNVGFSTFDTPGGPSTWAGSRIYEGSQFNRIFNSTFSRYGAQSGTSPDFQDHACNLDIGNDNSADASDFNLVVNSTFFYGGHHILGVYSSNNVIRGNTFHNEEWYPCHRAETGGLCGNRNVIINSSEPSLNTRNVIEENAIVYAGVPPDQVSSAGLSVRTQHNIVRRNVFYACDSSGVTLSVDGAGNNDASNNHIYANVFYRNGYLLLDDWAPRKYGLMFARWVDNASYNAMTGIAVKNNIFHDNNLGALYFYNVAAEEQTVADNWEERGDPGFVRATGDPDPFDFEALDFRLSEGSPCIDKGGFLTTAVSAGQNSTALTVADAGYFFDGYGVQGPDLIQLEGQNRAVAVLAIDYASHAITLAEPLSWDAGDGVSLPYRGARPDQGAYETSP